MVMDSQKQNQSRYAATSQTYDQSYHNNCYYTQQHDPYQRQWSSRYNTHYANSRRNQAQQVIPSRPSSGPPRTAEHGGGVVVSGEQNGYSHLLGQHGGGQPLATMPAGMNSVMAAAALVLAQFAGAGGGFGPGLVSGLGQTRIGPGQVNQPAGGGPSQGTARGSFSRRLTGKGRSGSSFHGRGYFRGRDKPLFARTRGALSSPRRKASGSERAEPTEKEEGSSANCHQEETEAQAIQQTTAPAQRNTTKSAAWCELCKVRCTSLEMLEQEHKTGKRHKKNLQKMEKLGIVGEPLAKNNNPQTAAGGLNIDESLNPGNLLQGKRNEQCLTEISNSETGSHENKLVVELQSDKAKQDNSAELQCKEHREEPLMNSSSDEKQGMKRKIQDGHGGRCMKLEPHKPKVVIPLICDLCNARCDTQEIFNHHISGKKHIANLKRSEGNQATCGSIGLQALYPPNPITQTLLRQGSQQGPSHMQQSSYPPPGALMPPHTDHSAAAVTHIVLNFQHNPKGEVSTSMLSQ